MITEIVPTFYPQAVAEAERMLVGQVLLDSKVFAEVALTPHQFYDPKCSAVWEAVTELQERAVETTDAVVIADQLERDNKLHAVGGIEWLTDLALLPSTAANAGYYAEIVRNAWLRRACLDKMGRAKELYEQDIEGTDILSQLQGELDDLDKVGSRERPNLADSIRTEVKSINLDLDALAQGRPIYTGLADGLGLDAVVPGGLPTNRVTLLFGETGNFKSTVTSNIIDAIAQSGVGPVLDMSYEDQWQLRAQRALSRASGVPYGNLAARQLTPDDVASIQRIPDSYKEAARQVYVIDNALPSYKEVIRLTRQARYTQGVKAVAVDYLQCLEGCEGYDAAMTGRAMTAFQRAAKRDKVAYIVVSQIKAIDRDDRRPQLGDLLGGSSIRNSVKLAIAIYRPYRYHRVPREQCYVDLVNNHPNGSDYYYRIVELWIRKNVVGVDNFCVRTLVEPSTGFMMPLPQELKQYGL